MLRRVSTAVLIGISLVAMGCTNKKVQNPIANINSKQPDKVLFDRAMDAMKHNHFDVARLSLQTLINTYPDSEFVARAKLAIGDSWYAEGGSAAMAQAESEYKDFETFFPNMPEAAEAQLKIANIHYREMEKPDRDYTHAKRAEEEYRYLIMTYPDSKLVPEAKQRLLEVQEVLAEREYLIGHFYFMRESWPAAIARLKSAVDTYPLYSGADDALFELGSAYEREADLLRASKLPEASKGKLIKQYNDEAAQAYGRIITRYPLQSRANEAKARLNAMKRPIPRVTEAAIAQNRAEIASRGSMGMMGKMMSNFHKHPEVYEATKIGEPTLVDPKQASAPEMVRAAGASILAGARGGNNKATVERIDANGTLAENAPVPRSETAGAGNNSASAGAAADGTQPAAGGSANGTPAAANAKSDIPELQNDLPQPAGEAASSSTAQAPTATQMPSQSNDATPPTQVNDAAASSQGDSASASNNTQQAAAIDPNKESSSKKSKKHKWNPF